MCNQSLKYAIAIYAVSILQEGMNVLQIYCFAGDHIDEQLASALCWQLFYPSQQNYTVVG